MQRGIRRRTVATIKALLLGAFASPAIADPDPANTVGCLSQTAGDVTTFVDPAGPGTTPPEVPGTACLTP